MSAFDEAYYLAQLEKLLSIDSTVSQYEPIQQYLQQQLAALGYTGTACHKGGLLVELGGSGEPLVLAAHTDDIGLMVRHINDDGTLKVCGVGALFAFHCMGENVRLYTRTGKIYTGSVCRTPNSLHLTQDKLCGSVPDWDTNTCIVLDENVHTADEVRALGIAVGDILAPDARFTVSNGYLKSRFLDDKCCVALLLSLAKALGGHRLDRKVYLYFTAYEEVGHGAAWLPENARDIIALDIAPTGPQQTTTEHTVTIVAKNSKIPYHRGLVSELCRAAERAKADYVVDVLTPHYVTDADVPAMNGYDVRFAALGPGTGNSHGYERTHMDAIRNTFDLLKAYLNF